MAAITPALLAGFAIGAHAQSEIALDNVYTGTSTNSSATTVLTPNLTGISGPTVVMKVNGVTKDVSNAVSGDTIAVTVSAPYSSVSWLPTASSSYLSGLTLTGSASMCRE